MEKTVFIKDISELKEFKKYGDTFKQVRNNPETGWWLYERPGHYEVVKGKKCSNPDGSVVYRYPSSEDWGTYGYTVPKCWWAEETINFLMGRTTTSAQELYEFKKTLEHPFIHRRKQKLGTFPENMSNPLTRGKKVPKNTKNGDTFYGFSISQVEAWEKLN